MNVFSINYMFFSCRNHFFEVSSHKKWTQEQKRKQQKMNKWIQSVCSSKHFNKRPFPSVLYGTEACIEFPIVVCIFTSSLISYLGLKLGSIQSTLGDILMNVVCVCVTNQIITVNGCRCFSKKMFWMWWKHVWHILYVFTLFI